MVNFKRLRLRVERFQEFLRNKGIDAAMIRTLSSFTYFTGVKWLRPALLIPADGDPIAFIFKYEAEEFAAKTWITNIKTYVRVEELMKMVTGSIRNSGFKKVGFDFSVERDSYVLFFELFKKMNPQIEIVDVHSLIMKLRMVKDEGELDNIKRASKICEAGMKKAVESIDIGRSELDIAAEALNEMMKRGAEDPHVYVTAGPKPRIHAEPRSWNRISSGDTVEIVISADYNGYYSNLSRTVFLGKMSIEKWRICEVYLEALRIVEENLNSGVKLIDIEHLVQHVIYENGYGDYYVAGFTHGVGLLIEEDPITTIIPSHRQYMVQENMVLAFIHAPLTVPNVGTVKFEDTYLIRFGKPEKLTNFSYKLAK
ncbi:MAG: aminopeptidase P family protein [Candidatus Verstraetearchaeota archaeon]|nr:aminopeptidase P family protein [Candidatus Verstraetearchaeota archaeon]